MLRLVLLVLWILLRAAGATTAVKMDASDAVALRALYETTNGPAWGQSNGWAALEGNGTVYCDGRGKAMFGVHCSATGNVTQLWLHRNRLKGSIPELLYTLTSVTTLKLQKNSLHGIIPPELGNLTSVTVLDLSSNSLKGSIPPELGKLTAMTYLDLDTNSLHGTIPPQLGKLNSMTSLRLYSNSLSGIIPAELGNLTSVTHLDLSSNSLKGSIPPELGKLTSMTYLDLDTNSLHGVIPPQLGSLNSMTVLYLHINSLSGIIPAELGNLTSMTSLWLNSNSLSGIIPAELGNLTSVAVLRLDSNSLTGTVPEWLYKCNKLTTLSLRNNFLVGPIPESLYKLSQLKLLQLNINYLTGTISDMVHEMNALSSLQLGNNSLTGSITEAFCNCNSLTQIYLYHNSLTGTLPACLGESKLRQLALHRNSLTGSFPVVNGGWNALTLLDLGANQLTGTFPSTLPRGLSYLGLDNNHFHGTVPYMAFMNSIIVFKLSHNSFSGQIPKLNSSNLQWALFDRNRFRGQVPWASLLCLKSHCNGSSVLKVLSLASNQLSGSIAVQLPSSLNQLLLDNNQFSGLLPSFASLSHLQTLTVHENQCHGKLHLPQNISSLTAVFAHNNRGLSCPISGGGVGATAYLPKQNLLLAGNRFSSPVPEWEPMHAAPAMYVASEFDQWKERIVYAAIGLPLLLGCAVAVHGKAVQEFFFFQPAAVHEHLQWWSAKAIGIMGVPLLLVMLPLYAKGANLYECGEAWLRTTSITYLSDDPIVEWLVAAMACVAAIMQSCVLVAMGREVDAHYPPAETAQTVISWGTYVKIVLPWLAILVLFSVPAALYSLSTALPTDNILGLNKIALEVSLQAAVVLLHLMVCYMAPYTAAWLVRKVVGHAEPTLHLTSRLMLALRLTVGVVVPTVMTFLFNNECLGWWLYLWQPCADDASSFDVSVQLKLDGHFDYNDNLAYFSRFNSTYQVTTHSQICNPAWKPQRCSRAVFSVVGNLILSKVMLAAFLGPGAKALWYGLVKPRLWKWQEKEIKLYRSDVELSFTLMFFEYTFIFGFIMPLMLPLIVMSLLMNCAVYHCVVRTLQLPVYEAARPSFEYLQLARVIGIAGMAWFYLDNDLHGQLVMCIGVPLCAVIGDFVASRVWAWSSLQNTTPFLHMLEVPLLDPGENETAHQMSTEMIHDAMTNT